MAHSGFLLLKSLVGGYIAGMLPFWLARWIPADVNLPSWFQWVLAGVSVAAVSVVEPILFIGFTMLYLKTTDVRAVAEPKPVAVTISQKARCLRSGLVVRRRMSD